jgi:hypothetical protein
MIRQEDQRNHHDHATPDEQHVVKQRKEVQIEIFEQGLEAFPFFFKQDALCCVGVLLILMVSELPCAS